MNTSHAHANTYSSYIHRIQSNESQRSGALWLPPAAAVQGYHTRLCI
jgi:hypothetical protein